MHFIFGLKNDFGGIPFGFCHWAAVRSASKLNPAYEIHLWYEFEPENHYFEDIKKIVTLHQVKAPTEIYGNPIPHHAHRADVMRLQILLEHGGVYLDLDTLTVQPYDFFLKDKVAMAIVKNNGNIYGLCNAVVIAQPGAVFLAKWLEAFKDFRSKGSDQFYDEFACEYPLKLAQAIPQEINVYNETLFFIPDMTENGIKGIFFDPNTFNLNAHCYHLWERNCKDLLAKLNEFNYFTLNGIYSRCAKAILYDEIEKLKEMNKVANKENK